MYLSLATLFESGQPPAVCRISNGASALRLLQVKYSRLLLLLEGRAKLACNSLAVVAHPGCRRQAFRLFLTQRLSNVLTLWIANLERAPLVSYFFCFSPPGRTSLNGPAPAAKTASRSTFTTGDRTPTPSRCVRMLKEGSKLKLSSSYCIFRAEYTNLENVPTHPGQPCCCLQ